MKPCPHCNSKYAPRLRDLTDTPSPKHVVICHNCGARGPGGVTRELAVEAWDKRPIEDEHAAEIEQLHASQQTERVPDGTYKTKHGDGLISYGGNNQLSVSQLKKRMVIFVGTLPDGWELRRPAMPKDQQP